MVSTGIADWKGVLGYWIEILHYLISLDGWGCNKYNNNWYPQDFDSP
jgi:hypothetical protein